MLIAPALIHRLIPSSKLSASPARRADSSMMQFNNAPLAAGAGIALLSMVEFSSLLLCGDMLNYRLS